MNAARTSKRHAEAVRLLMSLPRFTDTGATAYRPGLERIRFLLDAMGNPESDYPIVHVAGSNGKGTVASVVASILATSGLRVGLHTSPHILEIGERMRVNGAPADRDWLANKVLAYRREMERIRPSFFEMTVALSLLRFSEAEVDTAVVEVGLGGRLDATNAITPVLSVITNISLDHTDILGTTVDEIAAEKAGIIKEGVPIVTGVRGSAERVIRSVAADRRAPYENVRETCSVRTGDSRMDGTTIDLLMPSGTISGVHVTLPMEHQVANALLGARCAVRFLETTAKKVDSSSVKKGIEEVRERSGLSGRFEILSPSPLVIADVAHNGEGIAALITHVKRHMPRGRLHVCLAMMRDKQTDEVQSVLRDFGAHVIAVSVDSQRAFSAAQLASRLKQPQMQVDTFRDVGHAMDWFRSHAAPDDVLVITGSHLAVADAVRRNAPADEIPETRLSQVR